MRTRPRSACAATISPTATGGSPPACPEGGLLVLVLDDLEDDLAVGAGGGGIQDRADRFCGTPLLADHPAQVLFRHPELEDRRRLTLCLVHLDGVGVIH